MQSCRDSRILGNQSRAVNDARYSGPSIRHSSLASDALAVETAGGAKSFHAKFANGCSVFFCESDRLEHDACAIVRVP